MKKLIKTFCILSFLAIFGLMGAIAFYNINLPDMFYVESGKTLELNTKLSISYDYTDPTTQGEKAVMSAKSDNVRLKLFGIFPIKDTRILSVKESYLIPCGQPFGIKLLTEGVLVIGISEIQTSDGLKNPAKSAGIKLGDIIISINKKKVESNDDVQKIIEQSKGQKLRFAIKRKNQSLTVYLTPVKDIGGTGYKAGIWVRDSSAGIGTMTFYDPASGNFGGLGHGICDVDTGEILPLSSGEAVDVKIIGIQKGTAGTAGELKGVFTSDNPKGFLSCNTETGVYGQLLQAGNLGEPMLMAQKQEVKTGKAQIICTVQNGNPQKYDVEIQKIAIGDKLTKNMVIKITDKKLLELTGGIVQGMSGSPIIQDNKIVGAVTHVFLNDPTKGYGIFIENMYYQMNKYAQNNLKSAS